MLLINVYSKLSKATTIWQKKIHLPQELDLVGRQLEREMTSQEDDLKGRRPYEQ